MLRCGNWSGILLSPLRERRSKNHFVFRSELFGWRLIKRWNSATRLRDLWSRSGANGSTGNGHVATCQPGSSVFCALVSGCCLLIDVCSAGKLVFHSRGGLIYCSGQTRSKVKQIEHNVHYFWGNIYATGLTGVSFFTSCLKRASTLIVPLDSVCVCKMTTACLPNNISLVTLHPGLPPFWTAGTQFLSGSAQKQGFILSVTATRSKTWMYVYDETSVIVSSGRRLLKSLEIIHF